VVIAVAVATSHSRTNAAIADVFVVTVAYSIVRVWATGDKVNDNDDDDDDDSEDNNPAIDIPSDA